MKTFEILTRSNQRNLKANEKLQENGIIFTRKSNGDGLYSVCIMSDGQRVHRIVGLESQGTTREQALDFINKIKIEAKEQRLNLPKGRKTIPTFYEISKKYLLNLEASSNSKDLKMKRMRLKYHLIPFFKNIAFSKISSFEIEKYKKLRLSQSVLANKNRLTKPSTVNRELSVLSNIFNKAVEWGWIDKIPCKIPKFKEENNKLVYLTVKEINKVLKIAKQDFNPIIYPLLSLAIKTGMRKSELFSIKLEEIDLERKIIYIPKAKAGAREQPISGSIGELLREYIKTLNNTIWLFPSPANKSEHIKDIRGSFKRILKKANLDPKEITLHTLRHTAITHLVQAKVDLPTVQRISGHKTLSMVMRYSHQNGEHIQQALNKLERRVG